MIREREKKVNQITIHTLIEHTHTHTIKTIQNTSKKYCSCEQNNRSQECRLTNTFGHGYPPRLTVIHQFPCAVVTEQVDTPANLGLVAFVACHSAPTAREGERQ